MNYKISDKWNVVKWCGKIIKKKSKQKAEDIKMTASPSDQLNIGMLEIGQDSDILKWIQENNQEKW